jgi:hypothetical protein
MRRAAPLVVAVLALAAPAGSTVSSGLVGKVSRGPITPVCRLGKPCSAPAAGVVLVFRRAGEIAQTRTNAWGRYRIGLAPGSWSASTARSRLGRGLVPAQVQVVAGQVATVNFSIDTGIR